MKRKLILIAACLGLAAGAVFALDDEPDQLSWELFSQDRDLLLHFYDWAKANPPPIQTSQTSQTSQTFPYVWIKPAELPFVGANWRTDTVSRVTALVGKRYAMGTCEQTFEVPEDGTYRLWIHYRHTKGMCEANSFRLTPKGSMFAVFDQQFGRANGHRGGIAYTRPRNPAPQICDVETPKDGFLWEASHKTAFLRKGQYTARYLQGVVTTPRGDIVVPDIVLAGDPFFSPEGMSRAKGESGRLPLTAETKSPLYALRPGARDVNEVSPELAAWWRRWRAALWDRLIAAEHTKDYVWGGFADLKAFDERLNAVGRVSQLRKLAQDTRKPSDIYHVNADAFETAGKWSVLTGQYNKVACAHALFLPGNTPGKATYRLKVKRAGSYYFHGLVYLPHMPGSFVRGALRLSVSAGGKTVGETKAGLANAEPHFEETTSVKDGVVVVDRKPVTLDEHQARRVWCRFGPFELPAGEVELAAEDAGSFEVPPKKGRIWHRIFCRAVLTQRDDYNPELEQEFPQGDRVGGDEIGFWRSPDPWTAFSRYSPPATGKLAETIGAAKFRRYDWMPLADGEVNRAAHEIPAARGEVLSELLVIRNNSEKVRWIEPELSGDLGGRVRLISWAPAPDGEFVPRFLLERKRIVLLPHQNTALWVNIDCRGAKEGTHPVKLAFAGREHTWNVKVKGSIEGVPGPYAYPWAQPDYRKSCFELYRELGFNVISASGGRTFREMTKAVADEYGIRQIRLDVGDGGAGLASRAKEAEKLAAEVKASAADWRRRGFDDKDFCYCLSDEPGYGSMTNWLKIAKAIKAADPKAQIWCNTGFFPNEKQWDDCREFMSYWEVFCPFWHAFVMRPNRSAERLKEYQKIGRIRLGYITPSTSVYWTSDGAHESEWFARICRNEGRDGWSTVRFQTCAGWDLDHPLIQPIFTGAWGRTLSTRYAESARAANQWWRKMDAGVIEEK